MSNKDEYIPFFPDLRGVCMFVSVTLSIESQTRRIRQSCDLSSCMNVCLTVTLCDCIHGKEQHQLRQGERSFNKVLFSQPHKQTWLVTHHWLSCRALKGLKNHDVVVTGLICPN